MKINSDFSEIRFKGLSAQLIKEGIILMKSVNSKMLLKKRKTSVTLKEGNETIISLSVQPITTQIFPKCT